LHQPKLLILDEPTSGLDPLMQNRFFDLMEEENKKGTTIFFSSHILSEIQRLCTRAAVIREGAISAIEEIQVLLEKQMKRVRVVFATLPADKTLPKGSQHEKWNGTKLSFEFVGPVGGLIDWLSKQDLHDAVLIEPDLESIFMNYYQQ
jgi:ABC-2 type transport system ATP-binding protein